MDHPSATKQTIKPIASPEALTVYAEFLTAKDMARLKPFIYLQNVLEALREAYDPGEEGTYTTHTARTIGEGTEGKPPSGINMLVMRPSKPHKMIAGNPIYKNIMCLTIRGTKIIDCTDEGKSTPLVTLNNNSTLSTDDMVSLKDAIASRFARASIALPANASAPIPK